MPPRRRGPQPSIGSSAATSLTPGAPGCPPPCTTGTCTTTTAINSCSSPGGRSSTNPTGRSPTSPSTRSWPAPSSPPATATRARRRRPSHGRSCCGYRRSPPATPPPTAATTCTPKPAASCPPTPRSTTAPCGPCCAPPPGTYRRTAPATRQVRCPASPPGGPGPGPATDLRAWATEHDGHHWHLPQRWRWIPAEDHHTSGPGSAQILQQLCQALHHYTAVLVLAAGEPDALDRVELVVSPEAVDPDTGALTYRPHDLPGCPTITVPWRRIVAVHDAW